MRNTLMGRWNGVWAIGVALGLAVMWGGGVKAERVRYDLDPARSKVTLQGSVNALGLVVALNEQAPGSLTAKYTGAILADVTGTTIAFPGGSSITPVEEKEWEPGLGGEAGKAMASYAAQAKVSLFILSATAKAAGRRIVFDANSPVTPLTSGEFSSKSVDIKFVDTANSVVDFNATGAITAKGSKVLSGLITNRVAAVGKVAVVSGVETLTIPVDAKYSFSAATDDGQTVVFDLIFTGTLVGTRSAGPVETPVVSFEMPAPASGNPLKLLWSPSYKLQRATQLVPPNWSDFATESPITVPLTKPGEYFRVVKKNP